MKYKIKETTKFRKDFKNIVKQGLDITELKEALQILVDGKKLPEKYRDHKLNNDKEFVGCRELHIRPDWLLIYKYSDTNLILYLIRTGSHSDLYK